MFLVKSAESLENKRVEFLDECKKTQKSAQEFERKGIGDGIGRAGKARGGTPPHQDGSFSKRRSCGKSIL